MITYILVHCKHNGCNQSFTPAFGGDHRKLFGQVSLNSPKVFLFYDKSKANEFFHEYMNDVDVIDERCKKSGKVEHIDFCTCGILDLDDEGDVRLFYNKTDQIYLLEISAQVYMSCDETQISVNNANLTRRFMRDCKKLEVEQRNAYIELGKMCMRCNDPEVIDESSDETSKNENEKNDPEPIGEEKKPVKKPRKTKKNDTV